MSKKTVSYKAPAVNAIIDNLYVADITAETLSNNQKSYERQEWFKLANTAGKMPELFINISKAIDALPAGDVILPTFSAKTGKHDTKKVNYRDNAKRSFSTAFKNFTLQNADFTGKILEWKLSAPTITSGKVKPVDTLEDKISKILKETVDSKGLSVIMATITREQDRNAKALKAMAAKAGQVQARKLIISDYQLLLDRGCTIEQAVAKVAVLHDMDTDKAIKALGIA